MADHEAQTQAEDRWHQSSGRLLPLVELRTRRIDGIWQVEAEALDLHVVLEQRVGSEMAYVELGSEEPDRGFRLGIESVERLIRVLTDALVLAK